ncbi:MAG TPA: hypothetical protein VK444_01420 [Methanobacteriaceae archaeon]|nr:hypothetical protein [Methanobacteriaceae archaeon]
MKNKSIIKIFLISLFVLGIANCAYSDSGPNISENQALKITQDYLNSHGLSYKAASAGQVVQLKSKQSGNTKWFTIEEFDTLTGGNKDTPIANFTANWNVVVWAWKVNVVNNTKTSVGAVYVNSETGKVISSTVKAANSTQPEANNTTTNATNQTGNNSSGGLNWILVIGVIVILIVVGFLIYRMR